MLKYRFLSFGMVLGIGFLLLVSLLLSAALTAVATYASSSLPIPPAAIHAMDFLFSVLFIAALMALIFKFLPTKIAWGDVWVGAALGSLLFTAGKFLIGFYIGKSVAMSAYGAAGSVVIYPRLDLLLRPTPLLRRGIHPRILQRMRLAMQTSGVGAQHAAPQLSTMCPPKRRVV